MENKPTMVCNISLDSPNARLSKSTNTIFRSHLLSDICNKMLVAMETLNMIFGHNFVAMHKSKIVFGH